MKGIIFTEFLELVEQEYGYEAVDAILLNADLPSGGIYTSIGTYGHSEMRVLMEQLSIYAKKSIGELQKNFGKHLFKGMIGKYKRYIKYTDNAFALLASIDNHIHVEVLKWYPDAEVPHFDIEQQSPTCLRMVYSSERKMADFAHGLIEGCLEFFNEKAEIVRRDISDDGTKTEFIITKLDANA